MTDSEKEMYEERVSIILESGDIPAWKARITARKQLERWRSHEGHIRRDATVRFGVGDIGEGVLEGERVSVLDEGAST